MTPAREIMPVQALDRLLAGLDGFPVAPALPVAGLCLDSRALKPGELFIALSGHHCHAMRHAAEAVAAGAAAILFDPAGGGAELAARDYGIPCLAVAGLDRKLGFLADRFFGEPSRELAVIGVTGTNGKTSCSHFIAQALAGDKPSAVVGTLGWGLPGALHATAHTTPDAIETHAVLNRLRGQGVATVAMEASSHGLEQGRLNGVRFRGGLFTNLSRDHLDYHGDMSAYLAAKLRLAAWPGLEFFAFNLDDASAEAIIARVPTGVRKIGFSSSPEPRAATGVEVVALAAVEHETDGIVFDACCGGQTVRVQAPVYGDFNVENLLAALAVLLGLGFEPGAAAARLGRVGAVPGRMERFATGGGTSVVVDYAHTPDALAKVLASLRRHCSGSLWVVFGCGGERDRGKRPQMGAIAEKLADHVVLTDDNPRGEDGDAIIGEILGGCQSRRIVVLRDRRAAIFHALQHAKADDWVLIAGKGHEETQEINGVKRPFSDRETLREFFRAPNSSFKG